MPDYVVCLVPFAIFFAYWVLRRRKLATASVAAHEASIAAGLSDPVSLHPVVDQTRCVGCRSCAAACWETPTHQVLELADGESSLVTPTSCIGHEACKAACPTL